MRPNGRAARAMVAAPASAATTKAHGSRAKRARTNARTPTTGIKMPNCGFSTAASAAKIAPRTVLPRMSAESAYRRDAVPRASTCPHTAESSQIIGPTAIAMAAAHWPRREAPRSAASRAVASTRRPSARIAGSFTRAPGSVLPVINALSEPTAHNTHM